MDGQRGLTMDDHLSLRAPSSHPNVLDAEEQKEVQVSEILDTSSDAGAQQGILCYAELIEPRNSKDHVDTTIHRVDSGIYFRSNPSLSNIVRKRSEAMLSHNVEIQDTNKPDFSRGLTSDEARDLMRKHGPNLLPEKKTSKFYIFASQLWQPMPCMIWLAAAIEASIQNFIDMAILIFIQFANATIAFFEITKAGDAVAALKMSLKPKSTVKRDNKWQQISAADIVPGDLVLLASGGAVPADCRINSGVIEVDQSALTGESLPVSCRKNDSCKMGSTVVRGEAECTVECTGMRSWTNWVICLLRFLLYRINDIFGENCVVTW